MLLSLLTKYAGSIACAVPALAASAVTAVAHIAEAFGMNFMECPCFPSNVADASSSHSAAYRDRIPAYQRSIRWPTIPQFATHPRHALFSYTASPSISAAAQVN
jgi:hypothetical protein